MLGQLAPGEEPDAEEKQHITLVHDLTRLDVGDISPRDEVGLAEGPAEFDGEAVVACLDHLGGHEELLQTPHNDKHREEKEGPGPNHVSRLIDLGVFRREQQLPEPVGDSTARQHVHCDDQEWYAAHRQQPHPDR